VPTLTDARDLREGFFAQSAPDRGLWGRRRIEFLVYGVPEPQGSMKSFAYQVKNKATGEPLYKANGKPLLGSVTTSDNPGTREWRRLVADAAQRAVAGIPDFVLFTDAVAIDLTFELPRPKSLPKKVTAHLKKPDTSKLLRSTEDALTGVIWKDDSQVVEVRVRKRYAEVNQPARAIVAVEG
jgi:Holliday junction resolvase RusA-like endonuclease